MNIKKLREKTGLSREDLASKMKVSLTTIYRWERGEVRPHRIFVEKLNRIFSGYRGEE